MATQKGVQPLKPFHGISGVGFSYPKIIQPILDKHCIACHGPQKTDKGGPKAGGLVLTGEPTWDKAARKSWSQSYRNLVRLKNRDGNTCTSKTLKWISPQSQPPMLPPYLAGAAKSSFLKYLEPAHYKVALSRAEKEKMAAWIDLLVPFSGDYTEGMRPDDVKTYNRGKA